MTSDMPQRDCKKEQMMRRAVKMCEGCPFRLKHSRAQLIELATIEPEEFSCHSESGYTETDIQCRGHWQVRHKFGKAINAWEAEPETS